MAQYKYKASYYSFKETISKVEITKETDHFVQEVGKNVKRSKETEYEAYLDTYKEAKQWFIDQSKKRIKNLEGQIKYHEDKINFEREKIEKFKMMEE